MKSTSADLDVWTPPKYAEVVQSDGDERKPDPDCNESSRTDWARVDAMADEEIDTSDILPLDEAFFQDAKLRIERR
jgi:hypothetical protein